MSRARPQTSILTRMLATSRRAVNSRAVSCRSRLVQHLQLVKFLALATAVIPSRLPLWIPNGVRESHGGLLLAQTFPKSTPRLETLTKNCHAPSLLRQMTAPWHTHRPRGLGYRNSLGKVARIGAARESTRKPGEHTQGRKTKRLRSLVSSVGYLFRPSSSLILVADIPGVLAK